MENYTNINKLTNSDMIILKILWTEAKPITASEMVKKHSDLSINTVQASLRKLLKSKLIKVADIVYSGTVLTRSYAPAISASKFAALQFRKEFQDLEKGISKTSFLACLLEEETDQNKVRNDIAELEQMLEDFKKRS